MTNHEKLKLSPRDNGYIRRFTRVIEYIYANLDEDPDLPTLAEVAALSPSHWHRIWQATYGESIFATVKRLRLHRAAGDLTYIPTWRCPLSQSGPVTAAWRPFRAASNRLTARRRALIALP